MFRLYIVPAIGTGATKEDARRPKYIFDVATNGAWFDYGYNPTFLCGVDLTPANDAVVVANADVFAFPFNLDTTISGGAVNSRKARLEDFLIPGDGVTNGMTERNCARYVAGLFQFVRKLYGVLGNEVFIDTSAKLNILWNTIPVNYQNAILTAASMPPANDTSFITATTQLRAILRNFADQWGQERFGFKEFTL